MIKGLRQMLPGIVLIYAMFFAVLPTGIQAQETSDDQSDVSSNRPPRPSIKCQEGIELRYYGIRFGIIPYYAYGVYLISNYCRPGEA